MLTKIMLKIGAAVVVVILHAALAVLMLLILVLCLGLMVCRMGLMLFKLLSIIWYPTKLFGAEVCEVLSAANVTSHRIFDTCGFGREGDVQ